MKKLHWFIPALSGLLVLSCNQTDTRMYTVINPDGSCYKLIEANSDSAFITGDTAKSNPFNVDLDSTWEVSWSYITPEYKTNWPLQSWKWDTAHKHETLNVRAKRHYASVDDMAKNFRLSQQHVWSSLKPKYFFEKQFRWFYTYYTYRETYPKIKTLDRIPLERYLTRDEAEFWFKGNPDMIKGLNGFEIKELTDKIDGNFNRWFSHNVLDEQYDFLLQQYPEIKGAPADRNTFIAMKDSAIQLCLNEGQNETKEALLAEIYDRLFKTKAFSNFNYQDDSNKLKELEEAILERFINYFTSGLDYHLILPGKILMAERARISGDTLSFNLTAERLVYSDYEIGATSRRANTWAFVLTGIIVLLAVGSMFVRRK
jgi:hypothetical protein